MFAIFPELLKQADKGDIEAVAVLVRKYFADAQVYVPNIRVAELCANAEITIDTHIQKGAARLEAWDAQGQFRIAISIHPEIRSLREQNYILAQMLGHVFLDLQPKMAKGELQRSIFEKKTSPLRALLLNPTEMTTIDEFALSLLLPKGMVKKAMSSLSTVNDAAAFFNVDLALFECRLAFIGYVAAPKTQAPSARGGATASAPSPKRSQEAKDQGGSAPASMRAPRAAQNAEMEFEQGTADPQNFETEAPRSAPQRRSGPAPMDTPQNSAERKQAPGSTGHSAASAPSQNARNVDAEASRPLPPPLTRDPGRAAPPSQKDLAAAAASRGDRTRTPPETPSRGRGNAQAAAPKNAAENAKDAAPTKTSTRGKAEKNTTENLNPDLSSMARVNRSVAARTYKIEGERPEINNSPQPSPGLERLRQLARKIDKSVDE